MKTPSLIRVKILKFMLSRIDELLTINDIVDGSNTSGKMAVKEMSRLIEAKMISSKINGYKLSFTNANFIINKHTELAIICNFSKIIKKKMKEIEKET